MTENRKFWLVWCPSHHSPFSQHATHGEALFEAHKLARRQPGDLFYVMTAEKLVQSANTIETPLH